jgi:putative ABC transport system permease protein
MSVGDRIEFLAGTTPINVEIVGWYRDTEDSGEILRYRFEDLTAAEPDAIPEVYRLALTPGSDPATIGAALAERIGPSARSEVLDTGRADIEPLMMVLRAIAAVLFLTAGINLLSTLLASILIIAGTAIVLSAALGAVALQRIATRTVADLVRGE